MVKLTGPGVNVDTSKDFYLRGTFSVSPNSAMKFAYGGFGFNMANTDNGNYVSMR